MSNTTRKQERFLQALVAGQTITGAARQCGIAEQTAHRWLKLPSVRAERERMETTLREHEFGQIITAKYDTMHKPKFNDAYVYTFAYPDGTVFYVGKGTGTRIKSHLYQAASSKRTKISRVATVIRSIWQQGRKVIIRKPYNYLSEIDALQREKELIALYGYEQLVNQPARVRVFV